MNRSAESKHLIRYTHPSRFDFEPYGSIWKAFGDNDTFVLYIQVSDDPKESNWIKLSNFLEVAFHEFIGESDFIENSLILFKLNEIKYAEELVKKIN